MVTVPVHQQKNPNPTPAQNTPATAASTSGRAPPSASNASTAPPNFKKILLEQKKYKILHIFQYNFVSLQKIQKI
jgi:hypothetical protein